jgi:hypothetical protein
MLRIVVIAISAFLLTVSALASTDPFLGKWRLDVRHSKYPGDTCPKTMTIEMRAAEDGIWYHSDALYKNGGEIHAQYTANYDGKQVVVMSARGMLLPVSLKRIDLHTVVASYSQGFQVVAVSRRVVSADGRRMTIKTTSKDKAGKSVTTVGFYVRQAVTN